MDVPFHSSGAISRAHYAIVRKVETASSLQSADQCLFLEIKSIREQLAHPKLHLDKCKECLIILLYCSTSVTPGFFKKDAFDFAFLHAINLAEAGKKIEDKRIGYLFCSEMMPLDHELRLMLVNTLRKDLESDDMPRVCLALENLIASPNEDVIPAVQSRLHDLLSHEYSHVKRRALMAFRALSIHNPALLDRIHATILRRLRDPDDSVVKAALALSSDNAPTDESTLIKTRMKANDILVTETSYLNETNQGMIIDILKCLRTVGVVDANIPRLLNILQEHARSKCPSLLAKAVILEIFRLLAVLKSDVFMSAEESRKLSVVQCIRHLLMSNKPNDKYLFVSCLECVDVAAWAGTTPDRAGVLDGDEFGRIMELLASPDQIICKKTLRIVNKVDPDILDAQISLAMKLGSQENAMDKSAIARVLVVALIRFEEDGARYAAQVLDLVENVEKTAVSFSVHKQIVETVLTDIRTPQNSKFLTSCAAHFVQSLIDQRISLGPTALVIATALSTEFCGSLPLDPGQILTGLASKLKTCPTIVQEPCIIAMLRVRADCDEVPSEVEEIVTTVGRSARSSIRRRCDQFVQFLQKKDVLLQIIREAASPSLPDFLMALQSHNGKESRSSVPTPTLSRASSRAARHSSTLNYAAYDPPTVGPRLGVKRMSGSQQSVSSSRSDILSDPHHYSKSYTASPPMTAGRLALAVGLQDLHIQEDRLVSSNTGESKAETLQMSRSDLITLDSPFQVDPFPARECSDIGKDNEDFEDLWHAFNASCDLRGWCKTTIDIITRRLQQIERHRLRVIAADVPPFIGELKILIVPDEKNSTSLQPNTIALRLRETEEDSCLWRLRCADNVVGARIQTILDM